jgi:tetratricopeptide (TPR) repeat protein
MPPREPLDIPERDSDSLRRLKRVRVLRAQGSGDKGDDEEEKRFSHPARLRHSRRKGHLIYHQLAHRLRLNTLGMESLNARIERRLVRIFLIGIGAVVLVSAAGYFGVRTFRAWQERRLLAEGTALVKEGDFNRASFDAQRALEINPKSAGANRVLAEVSERSGLRTALDFRRRVADLSRHQPGDELALARTAIRFGEARTAKEALEAIPPVERETANYHALCGDVALLQRDTASYEKELTRAAELDPANKTYSRALATLRLNSADPALHDRGVHELEQLQSDEALRAGVTRRLTDDALRRGEKEKSVSYARQLNALSSVNFSDRLLLLSALHLAGDAQVTPMLAQLQIEAGDDPEKIGALLSWMTAQKMSPEAVAWIQKLPAALLGKKLLPLNVADAFLAAADWKGLEKFLRASNWGPAEYLRAALLARALRELGRAEDSAQAWNEAVRQVNGHSEEIFLLAEMARKWGWEKDALDLLWLASEDPQKAEQTLNTLYNIYAARGDTQDLYRVLLHLEELRPNDPAILNNVAQLSLLLNLNTDRGLELAQQVYEQDPKNADYASTYAFSLYRRGEMRKAVQAFADVPEKELQRPQIAAYYGLMLAAAGNLARAREFLDLGSKANLLPEERALVDKAQLALVQR